MYVDLNYLIDMIQHEIVLNMVIEEIFHRDPNIQINYRIYQKILERKEKRMEQFIMIEILPKVAPGEINIFGSNSFNLL